MHVSKKALRERYESLTTDALKGLYSSSDLTATATSELRAVLAARGVSLADLEEPVNPYQQPKSNVLRADRRPSMRTLFRFLVAGNTLLYLIWFFGLYSIQAPFLSLEALIILESAGYGSRVPYEYWVNYFLLFCWVAVYIGLYRFERWARSALVILIIAGTVVGPFWGMSVMTSLSSSVIGFVSMVDGAVLVFCYFTSIAAHFNGTAECEAPAQQRESSE